ncbi:hypothetical protein R1sor_010668 [Riccia sorocarpa]|uniref:Uncharacterized protein n=1 Tax=Riccia sorocarpa TaxID=122646 RepID=A0ABD3I1G0_9MARC
MLNTQLQAWTIKGLKITEGDSLLHQLFSDDTRLFLQMHQHVFNQTRTTFSEFEIASGAKLNLDKTLLLPLRPMQISQWLLQTPYFLWGYDSAGKKKRPLIAWSTFAKRKANGALGWPLMEDLASAFLLKNLMKIMTNTDDEWVRLATAIIQHTLQNSNKPNEVR